MFIAFYRVGYWRPRAGGRWEKTSNYGTDEKRRCSPRTTRNIFSSLLFKHFHGNVRRNKHFFLSSFRWIRMARSPEMTAWRVARSRLGFQWRIRPETIRSSSPPAPSAENDLAYYFVIKQWKFHRSFTDGWQQVVVERAFNSLIRFIPCNYFRQFHSHMNYEWYIVALAWLKKLFFASGSFRSNYVWNCGLIWKFWSMCGKKNI